MSYEKKPNDIEWLAILAGDLTPNDIQYIRLYEIHFENKSNEKLVEDREELIKKIECPKVNFDFLLQLFAIRNVLNRRKQNEV